MVDHPGEKAKLAAQATVMLWQPSVRTTEGRPNQGGSGSTRSAAPPSRRSCSSSTRSAPSACSSCRGGSRRSSSRCSPIRLAVRDALRGRHALPRALGLPDRALRRDGARAALGARHAREGRHVHRMRGIGGSERHLLALLPGLAALGVEPVFVGLDDPAWDPEPFYERLTGRVGAAANAARPRPARSSAGSGARCGGADLVHTHLVHADVYGALAPGAGRSSRPSTTTIRSGLARSATSSARSPAAPRA